MPRFLAFAALIVAVAASGDDVHDDHGAVQDGCQEHNIDFILLDGDAELAAIEDDIRTNLQAVGINVNTRKLSKEDFNAAHASGDFHISFSETWGSPYDPHSYASGWISGNEGHKQALTSLEPPLTRDVLFSKIESVLTEEDYAKRLAQWREIISDIHAQAVMLPLWGKRIPTVMNKRLSSYQAGAQQFDYPVHKLKVVEGSKTVTIAPGAQTGRFKTVARLDPHTYRPNEFFANNWVYEGLVGYNNKGEVVPSLAKSWVITDLAGGGQSITFTLRGGVTFHDGTAWDCAAAKLNFDHVFAPPFVHPDWHGWYQLPFQLKEWRCDSATAFTLITKTKYAPLLQELSYIRPLRMLSPAAFANGAASSATTANSCHIGWGNVSSGSSNTYAVCAGITAPIGTGPFKFSTRTTTNVTSDDAYGVDTEVVFLQNTNYWAGAPDIETLKIKYYPTASAIKNALVDGSLDMVWGGGVLSPSDVIDIQDNHRSTLLTYHSDALQNVLLLLNSGKAPTNDIQLRKTLIHAIDKVGFINKELGGLQEAVDGIFPKDAPFCDVELTPKWDYDHEKAVLLNCPSLSQGAQNSNDDLALGLGVGFGLLALGLLIAAMVLLRRNKELEYELVSMKSVAPSASTAGQGQVVPSASQNHGV
jgi:ABC-type transport system substrate-binding protein